MALIGTVRAGEASLSIPSSVVLGLLASALLLAICTGCATPVVKTEALDGRLLKSLRREGLLVRQPELGEHVVHLDPASWMAVPADGPLTFVGLREDDEVSYAVVLECDPDKDALRLWPLDDGETPLAVLGSAERRGELEAVRDRYRSDPGLEGLREVSLEVAVAQRLFAPPLPTPGRIVATATNFRSHLVHDLDVGPEVIEELAQTPARVFQKHPPMHAPGRDPRPDVQFTGVIGPFDSVVYPDKVSLPDDEHGVVHLVPTFLDYEVELGFVVNRSLTWADIAGKSDEELWGYVGGYLLVSDVKARNPQVFERILARGEVPTEVEQRYLTGDPHVDQVIGRWDEATCEWWSYAASQGNYAGLGPYLVAAEPGAPFPEPALACARSYATEDVRGVEPPRGRQPGELYLRQLARVTLTEDDPDRLIWDPPAVLRAILLPNSALRQASEERRLEAGDIVALGTPGGIALTVNRSRGLDFLQKVLFWWDAIDWHDAFFGRDRSNYLQPGDEVFLWGEGLGYQHGSIQRFELPPLPEKVEVPTAAGAQL